MLGHRSSFWCVIVIAFTCFLMYVYHFYWSVIIVITAIFFKPVSLCQGNVCHVTDDCDIWSNKKIQGRDSVQ